MLEESLKVIYNSVTQLKYDSCYCPIATICQSCTFSCYSHLIFNFSNLLQLEQNPPPPQTRVYLRFIFLTPGPHTHKHGILWEQQDFHNANPVTNDSQIISSLS